MSACSPWNMLYTRLGAWLRAVERSSERVDCRLGFGSGFFLVLRRPHYGNRAARRQERCLDVGRRLRPIADRIQLTEHFRARGGDIGLNPIQQFLKA